MGSDASGEAIAILAIVVGAFFIGEALDASRDLLENAWDKFQPVEWDFFAKAGKDEVDNLRTSHFTYYVFDCNVGLALVVLLLFAYLTSSPVWAVLVLVLFLIIFIVNAWRLRSEIASLTHDWRNRNPAP
jgi:hypothetical protein